MKKSNIILLILILSLPLALLAHQLVMRAQYKNGHIRVNGITPPSPVEYIALPAFSNIMVNGSLRQPASGNAETQRMNVQILINDGVSSFLTIRKDLLPLLNWEVRNDTLFCSFQHDGRDNMKPFIPNDVHIQVPQISNVRVDSANLSFSLVNQHKPLSLALYHLGSVKMEWLNVPFIYIIADESLLNIASGEVDLLRYSTLNGGKVVPDLNVQIKKQEDISRSNPVK